MKKQNINFLVELFSLIAFCKFMFPLATSSEASTACRNYENNLRLSNNIQLEFEGTLAVTCRQFCIASRS